MCTSGWVCAQKFVFVLVCECISFLESPYRRKACNSYLFGSTLMCRKILSKFNDPKGRYRFSFLLRQYFVCDIDLPQMNVCLRYNVTCCNAILHKRPAAFGFYKEQRWSQLATGHYNKKKKTSLLHVHISSYVCTNIYVCMLSYTHITHKHVNVYLYVYVHMCVYM